MPKKSSRSGFQPQLSDIYRIPTKRLRAIPSDNSDMVALFGR